MANRWFASLSDRFILVSTDTRKGIVDLIKPYGVHLNRSYLLVLDTDGKLLVRHEYPRTLTTSIQQSIEKAYEQFVQSQLRFLDYALTYGQATVSNTAQLQQLVSKLASDDFLTRESASREILAFGESAYQHLKALKIDNAEVAWRIQTMNSRLKSLRDTVERNQLYRDIPFLSRHAANHPKAKERLGCILPRGVEVNDAVSWWQSNQHAYQWDTASQRYLRSLELTQNK